MFGSRVQDGAGWGEAELSVAVAEWRLRRMELAPARDEFWLVGAESKGRRFSYARTHNISKLNSLKLCGAVEGSLCCFMRDLTSCLTLVRRPHCTRTFIPMLRKVLAAVQHCLTMCDVLPPLLCCAAPQALEAAELEELQSTGRGQSRVVTGMAATVATGAGGDAAAAPTSTPETEGGVAREALLPIVTLAAVAEGRGGGGEVGAGTDGAEGHLEWQTGTTAARQAWGRTGMQGPAGRPTPRSQPLTLMHPYNLAPPTSAATALSAPSPSAGQRGDTRSLITTRGQQALPPRTPSLPRISGHVGAAWANPASVTPTAGGTGKGGRRVWGAGGSDKHPCDKHPCAAAHSSIPLSGWALEIDDEEMGQEEWAEGGQEGDAIGRFACGAASTAHLAPIASVLEVGEGSGRVLGGVKRHWLAEGLSPCSWFEFLGLDTVFAQEFSWRYCQRCRTCTLAYYCLLPAAHFYLALPCAILLRRFHNQLLSPTNVMTHSANGGVCAAGVRGTPSEGAIQGHSGRAVAGGDARVRAAGLGGHTTVQGGEG